MPKTCPYCNEVLVPRQGQVRLNPKRRFCDFRCRTRYNVLENYHNKYKKSKIYMKKKNDYYKKWYKKNSDRQKKNIHSDYYKNKDKWRERGYVNLHKEEIWELLGRVCVKCGGYANEINHLTYDLPSREHLRIGKNRVGVTRKKLREMHKEYIKEYVKYLEPICTKCHRAIKPSYKETNKLFQNQE